MRLVLFLKNALIFKFLKTEFKRSRLAFFIILLVFVFHAGANLIKSNIFPVFIYSMYSEPQYSMPTTTDRYVFYADDKPIHVKNMFVQGRISGPVERYFRFKENKGEDPITNKRINYFSYFFSNDAICRFKNILYKKSVDLAVFKDWYKKYFAQYISIKYSKLSVYQFIYSLDDLENPKQIHYLFSLYE